MHEIQDRQCKKCGSFDIEAEMYQKDVKYKNRYIKLLAREYKCLDCLRVFIPTDVIKYEDEIIKKEKQKIDEEIKWNQKVYQK